MAVSKVKIVRVADCPLLTKLRKQHMLNGKQNGCFKLVYWRANWDWIISTIFMNKDKHILIGAQT